MNPDQSRHPAIAVIIPAYNEEKTIAKTIAAFARQLPDAQLVIINNNSADNTVASAQAALAASGGRGVILHEPRQGKAMAMRTAFHAIHADFYVMVDADNTYPAEAVHELLQPALSEGVDMVVGDRHSSGAYSRQNKRKFHGFGNSLVTRIINLLFHSRLRDIMSGYRVLSRTFVKFFPILSSGFEIETEMTLHALDKRFLIREIPITYIEREQGSVSKLNTFSDGARILRTILRVCKDFRPLFFFGTLATLAFGGGVLAGLPVIIEFIRTRLIFHIPLTILATGLMIFALLFLTIGLILDTVAKFQRFNYELKILSATRYPAGNGDSAHEMAAPAQTDR
jgi:glycosyltransferase involved in cell wall biosynthesis